MKIRKHQELEVYQEAFSAAMEIFETSKKFPKDEKYSLTDRIRRSSRSVWRVTTATSRRTSKVISAARTAKSAKC